MNESDRQLIIAIGAAARSCAMYRELLDVARRYGNTPEVDRLTGSLAAAERTLVELIDTALADTPAGAEATAAPGGTPSGADQPGGSTDAGADEPAAASAAGDQPAGDAGAGDDAGGDSAGEGAPGDSAGAGDHSA